MQLEVGLDALSHSGPHRTLWVIGPVRKLVYFPFDAPHPCRQGAFTAAVSVAKDALLVGHVRHRLSRAPEHLRAGSEAETCCPGATCRGRWTPSPQPSLWNTPHCAGWRWNKCVNRWKKTMEAPKWNQNKGNWTFSRYSTSFSTSRRSHTMDTCKSQMSPLNPNSCLCVTTESGHWQMSCVTEIAEPLWNPAKGLGGPCYNEVHLPCLEQIS